MKLSTVLPILAVSADEKKIKKAYDGNAGVERFVASEYRDQCSDTIPGSRGMADAWKHVEANFLTTNDGSRGTIRLENYPNNAHCKHVVQANSSCKKIVVTYRYVAVEGPPSYQGRQCPADSFRFEWADADGFKVTPPLCDCYGAGCDYPAFLDYPISPDYGAPYAADEEFMSSYWHNWKNDSPTFPDSFSIDANRFTFYFTSDYGSSGGRVILDWECVGPGDT